MPEKFHISARPTFLRREARICVAVGFFHDEVKFSLRALVAERNFLHPEFCALAEAHIVLGVEDAA